MNVWQLLISVAGGLVLVWIVMVIALYAIARGEEDPARLRDVLRLVPDVLKTAGVDWPRTQTFLEECGGVSVPS